MGGDTAPQAEIAGALQALATLQDQFIVQLVGRPEVINAELAKYPDADRSRLEVREAAEVIGMAEKPLAAVRSKRKSSIVVGLGLQKAGESDAFVSAGNTGALLAASTLLLGLHDGVERAPSQLSFLPATNRFWSSMEAPTSIALLESWSALPTWVACTCGTYCAGPVLP